MGLNVSSKVIRLSQSRIYSKKKYDIININAFRIVTRSIFGQSMDYGMEAFSMLTTSISSSEPTVPAIKK